MDTTWELGFSARPLLIGRELFVGEWRCPGGVLSGQSELIRHVEIGLQHEGAHLRSIGRERRLVDVTTATLNAVGDEYRMSTPQRCPQRATAVVLRGALAQELVPRLAARFAPISAEAARLHRRLLQAPDSLAAEELALALLGRVLADADQQTELAPDPSPARRALAEQVQHLLATRYADRLTLESLAAACNSSPFHLSRVFSTVTGQTIHQQLTRIRLRMALFRLGGSAGRLTELALDVGFSSHSHFTAAFRREFGCAPSVLLLDTAAGRQKLAPSEPYLPPGVLLLGRRRS